MNQLLDWLNHSLQSGPSLALLAAGVWGVLSVVLSPCHLASVPLVVAVVSGNGSEQCGRWRLLTLSTVFAVGILLTFAVIGVATAAAGGLIGHLGSAVNYVVAGIFVLVGLVLLDVIPLSWGSLLGRVQLRPGAVSALLAGLVFGLAVGPCTFAYMAPVLGVGLKLATTHALLAAMLVLAFAIGHCAVIVLAGVGGGMVQRYLDASGTTTIVARRVTGALVVLAGLLVLASA